ncbi:hypothetical protein GDO86_011319 [Hymenochirus boettgeri]|uniref:MARVEL domain-containing protein n=1 Tax=Hymenochirus boettgeri TaxID=247094 RepID=A0A8T2JFX5_9PIPI|nr:hypothetical protein GDO86_011319 [Hymenochirus boettgeri]
MSQSKLKYQNTHSFHHEQPRRERLDYQKPLSRDQGGSSSDRRSHASNGRSLPQNKPSQSQTPQSKLPEQFSDYRKGLEINEIISSSETCSHVFSARGILQLLETIAGVLVLICVIASYAVITGYTSAAGFGSFSINSAYSPFEGNELKQVRDADMHYSQLRVPAVYGGVPFTLLVCVLTVFFLILGTKPLRSLNIRILIAEAVFDILACIAYIAAIGLYINFIKQVNSTEICKTRQRLYAGRGYTWMNCEVQGGDAAVALFGLIAACLYIPSAIFCVFYIKKIKKVKSIYSTDDYKSVPNKESDAKSNSEWAQFQATTFV